MFAWLGQAQPLLYLSARFAVYSSGWACPSHANQPCPLRTVRYKKMTYTLLQHKHIYGFCSTTAYDSGVKSGMQGLHTHENPRALFYVLEVSLLHSCMF